MVGWMDVYPIVCARTIDQCHDRHEVSYPKRPCPPPRCSIVKHEYRWRSTRQSVIISQILCFIPVLPVAFRSSTLPPSSLLILVCIGSHQCPFTCLYKYFTH